MEKNYSYIIDRDNVKWLKNVIDIIEEYPDNAYIVITPHKTNQNLILFYHTIEWIPNIPNPLVDIKSDYKIDAFEGSFIEVSPKWLKDQIPK
jgi:hypothetical protein